MFIPRSDNSSSSTTSAVAGSAVPIYIAIVLVAIFIGILMFLIFLWRSRQAARRDAEAQNQQPNEKQLTIKEFDPKLRAGLRPLELTPVPRAYTPFSSLPPRWSPRFSPPPSAAPALTPAFYSKADEKAILPLYPMTASVVSPKKSGRPSPKVVRSREQLGRSLERLDEQGRERVMGKLNGLITKIKVEYREL